ncbi:MAG TPA: VOC family protein [Gemmatales bacterium]|nr:VOC family protein [Gemmatales bacterium]HMP17994.1 VOC family protein [Gemmatales bacterium]
MLTKQTVIPQLRITQAQKTLPFYVDLLGFVMDWKHQFEPGFPLFVQLSRGEQTIFLTEHTGDCQPGGAVYFCVPDAVKLYAEMVNRGVVAEKPVERTPWGTLEFSVLDPDGNRLRFASDIKRELDSSLALDVQE